ncbi:hypothetical protein C8J57DRAFT_1522064 [Mycena rebaudengoi]|nr:hypothetical protein C8J57DRAFT_1522064 [Mycena rebaudengoi]
MDVSENPRPPKRARIAPPLEDATRNAITITRSTPAELRGPYLLLALPEFLQHSPTHPLHAPALCVVLILLSALSPTDECSA